MQRIPSLSRLARIFLLSLTLVLTACSSSRGPAPIVKRTGGDAVRPADVPRDSSLTPPAPVVVVPPSAEGGVQIAPVRPSGIESRPLDARAGTPAATAAVPPPVGSAVGGLGAMRTGPKGLKRPYTDAVLAEVKAADSPVVDPSAAVTPAAAGTAPVAAAPSAAVVTVPGTAGKPDSVLAKPAEAEKAAAVGSQEFAWPLRGKVIQPFAEPKQVGIVLDGKVGDPVSAAADGKVIFSGPGPRGYGNLLIVKHDAETVTVYAHNKTLLAKEGQSVKRGQKIAEVGDSGSDKVGLHFEVRKQGKPVDPQKLLPKR